MWREEEEEEEEEEEDGRQRCLFIIVLTKRNRKNLDMNQTDLPLLPSKLDIPYIGF